MADGDNSSTGGLWQRWSTGQRAALGLGVFAIVGTAAGIFWWAGHRDYAPLFTDLATEDAAQIVEVLKARKIPYEITANGTGIRVPGEHVLDTRLSLMASELPLNGGVGFELFDRQGLGATEQSQRVSYQRALQGELSRTIAALDPVQHARVHLVIPEASLFRREQQQPRAAVIVTIKPGARLSGPQISGIQRLVAAAVAGLDAEQVVVTDQRGVTLSLSDPGGSSAGAGNAQLALKKEVEDYLTGKVAMLLDGALGRGQALVSIDATLNFDAITRTTQDVTPVGKQGPVTRRREVTPVEPGADGDDYALESEPDFADVPALAEAEVDYELGRQVEQVVAAPGGLRRLSISVIVSDTLAPERLAQVAALVRGAAGADETRGDVIEVQPLGLMESPRGDDEPQAQTTPTAAASLGPAVAESGLPWRAIALGSALFFLFTLVAWSWQSRQRAALTPADRAALMAELEQALAPSSRPGADRPVGVPVGDRPGRRAA